MRSVAYLIHWSLSSFFWISLVAIGPSVSLWAQPVKLPQPEVITDRQGLPQAFVPAIVQDRQGFIWMATLDGLCRYDGNRFRVFQPTTDGRPALSSSGVLMIRKNKQGQLWIANDHTFDLFDPLRETFVNVSRQPFYKPFANHSLQDIYPDRRNRLWLIFTKRGLARIDLSTHHIRHYQHQTGNRTSLGNNQVRAILDDRQGAIWVATADGLDRLDERTQQFTHYRYQPGNPASLPQNDLIGLHERANGDLLVLSPKHLTILQPRTGQMRTLAIPQWSNRQGHVRFATDSQGNDYVGYNEVLFRFNEREGIHMLTVPGSAAVCLLIVRMYYGSAPTDRVCVSTTFGQPRLRQYPTKRIFRGCTDALLRRARGTFALVSRW